MNHPEIAHNESSGAEQNILFCGGIFWWKRTRTNQTEHNSVCACSLSDWVRNIGSLVIYVLFDFGPNRGYAVFVSNIVWITYVPNEINMWNNWNSNPTKFCAYLQRNGGKIEIKLCILYMCMCSMCITYEKFHVKCKQLESKLQTIFLNLVWNSGQVRCSVFYVSWVVGN